MDTRVRMCWDMGEDLARLRQVVSKAPKCFPEGQGPTLSSWGWNPREELTLATEGHATRPRCSP